MGSSRIRVYLSGGMHSGWRDEVIEACGRERFDFLDPRENGTRNPTEFSVINKQHIRSCDIVFAVLEDENPSGMWLACEVAFADAHGKTIILVNEKTHRYDKAPNAFASKVFRKLKDGIRLLQRFR